MGEIRVRHQRPFPARLLVKKMRNLARTRAFASDTNGKAVPQIGGDARPECNFASDTYAQLLAYIPI